MDLIIREPGERFVAGAERDFNIPHSGTGGSLLGRLKQLLAALSREKRRFRHELCPTLILRKRAGLAPCPVPITCSGCPLPQLGTPHNVQ